MTILEVIEQETGWPVDESTPLESLGVDSLEFLDLLLTIEKRTGIFIPQTGIGELHTIGDIVRMAS